MDNTKELGEEVLIIERLGLSCDLYARLPEDEKLRLLRELPGISQNEIAYYESLIKQG